MRERGSREGKMREEAPRKVDAILRLALCSFMDKSDGVLYMTTRHEL